MDRHFPDESGVTWMFTNDNLVANADQSQNALELVKNVATDGTQVRALHLRLPREPPATGGTHRRAAAQAALGDAAL